LFLISFFLFRKPNDLFVKEHGPRDTSGMGGWACTSKRTKQSYPPMTEFETLGDLLPGVVGRLAARELSAGKKKAAKCGAGLGVACG
jgi:hypothetical protein